MDDLQFRRTIYAEPHSDDEGLKQAAAQDSSKQQFWDELKQFDASLQEASRVEVPEGLADRLILRQSLQRHTRKRSRRNTLFAMAASVMFVFGLSFVVWKQQAGVMLDEHALAHVYHEADGYALKIDGDVTINEVNSKLEQIGLTFSEQVSRVFFANYCNFDSVKSFHMVMQGENGKVTVFVIPRKQGHRSPETFSDGTMHGETLEFRNAYVVMVAEQGQPFVKLREEVKRNLVFSA